MFEANADLWTTLADAKCITTNGFVKKNGEAVMGAGVAKQAKSRYPSLPKHFGSLLKEKGNHVMIIGTEVARESDVLHRAFDYVAFPVKHNWWEKADIDLIERSANELVSLTNFMGWREVLLPRPGCNNGKLNWIDVKKVIEPILDDRFMVVNKVGGNYA